MSVTLLGRPLHWGAPRPLHALDFFRTDQPQSAPSQAPAHSGAPPVASLEAPVAYGAAPLAPLPTEVDSGFAQVLHVLNGSKVHQWCFVTNPCVTCLLRLARISREGPSTCTRVSPTGASCAWQRGMGLLRMCCMRGTWNPCIIRHL